MVRRRRRGRRGARARARDDGLPQGREALPAARSGAPTDFGDVVDCRPGAPNSAANAARLPRASGATDVAGCPGLAVFPARSTPPAQRASRRACARLPPGTETNLGPAPGGAAPPPAGLRWATLGRHYDWSRRAYAAPSAVPAVSRRCAAPAAAGGGAFAAEAAIVNYYAPGDTMGGHVDDAEHDLTRRSCRCRWARGRAPRRRDARRAADGALAPVDTMVRVKAYELRTKNKGELLKQLEELKASSRSSASPRSRAAPRPLAKIGSVRKSIARVLTVYNQTQKGKLREVSPARRGGASGQAGVRAALAFRGERV
ncbi:ribosomal protein [Aureococcus anophagefferens]|nr:ribosomal protein [Aureococcus anophagefferens]